MNPDRIYYKYESCPGSVLSENSYFLSWFGQTMDKLWILMSNVCQHCLKSVIGLTEFGPDFDKDWTYTVHDLLLDRHWTESGQMLDKDWILRPTSVQPHFSNKHPFMCVLK